MMESKKKVFQKFDKLKQFKSFRAFKDLEAFKAFKKTNISQILESFWNCQVTSELKKSES